MTTYLALLRAINRAGHKMVAMADLRDLLGQLGFADPRSLLQSGNLVFGGQTRATSALERLLEAEAKKRLALETWGRRVEAIVSGNPSSRSLPETLGL